ncbi:MAG: polysaccharide biosynthesis tyrosine autokinase [Leptolyngbyaceae cyanobacterium HOT.MB2.61]|nr:polysaccharide biosynthesis tyrosine autokinase [Leptolyngbyaceae cyanobacterium HOT.MB2.61]
MESQEVSSKGLIGWRFQPLPLVNPNQSQEGDEGGLNLGQVVAALRRKIPIIAGVTIIVTSAATLKALTSTPTYQGSFEILTKPITVEAQVISSVPQTLSNREQDTQKGIDQTKLKLLVSPKLLSPIADKLKTQYPGFSYSAIAASLVVTPVPNSEILNVSYVNKDPELVKKVLDLVAKAYLDYSLEERLADVRQGIEFVDAQLPQLQQRVETIQDQLQSFRQQYNLIDPESQGKQLSEQATLIGQQRLETQIKLNEARALYVDLNNQLIQKTNESAASSALKDSNRYQNLLGQILDVQSQIAKEGTLFREDTPEIKVLRDQQRNLLSLLSQEGQNVQEDVASRIRELEARSTILAQTEDLLNRRVKQLSVISRQFTDIQRELKIATENLNQFLAKREALRIDAGQRKVPWQILTPPTAPIPSAANVKKTAMLGAILGLLLGVGLALLLDRLSNVLYSPDELKETKLPILGVIPFNPDLEGLEKLTTIRSVGGLVQQVRQRFGLDHDAKPIHYISSPFLEAFRSLYTNILLLGSDARIRSFVICSSVPGEGKSTVSVYLAQAAAALGGRVLLVDTDLRLPQLHNRLDLDNVHGLSSVISLNLDYEQVIQRSPLEKNLFVLTAGPVPPDPTKLLSSQKMQDLMEQFKEHFDLVIYDTPPLTGLADAKLIAAKTDGTVMVVGLGKTKSFVLRQALDGLKLSSVPVLGLVANGAKDYANDLYHSYHRYYASTQGEQLLDEEPTSFLGKPSGE